MKTFGITMGDSSGVGPEILLQSAASGQMNLPYVVYGDLSVLHKANRELGFGVPLRTSRSPRDLVEGAVSVLDHALLPEDDITPGILNAASGKAAREYVISAAKDALAGRIAAMITLPMNKEATRLSDPEFTGHTELIGSLCGVDDVTIMLASDDLIVTHVSTHMSLLEAIRTAKQPRIQRIIELTVNAVAKLVPSPRIAVAGLNPHAGENGLFGDEEIREIIPAVDWAQAQGFPVTWATFRRTRSSIWPYVESSLTRSSACTTIRGTFR